MHKFSISLFRKAGFTLAELMASVGIFTIGIAIAYPLLISDMNLYVRNFSINKSNNSLRYALQSLKNDIDMATESPRLMGYASNADGTGSLTPLALTTTNSDAIMIWVNRGADYKLMPVGQSATVDPSAGVILVGAKADPATGVVGSPVPQIGDRLIIQNPAPYNPAPYNKPMMADTVMMSGSSISKPGRIITRVDSQVNANDPASVLYTVQLDLANPLPANIPGNTSVYIAREVAYVAYTITDAYGNNIARQLLYCSNTNASYPNKINMITCKPLTSDLDPNPLLKDQLVTNSIIDPLLKDTRVINSTSAFNYLFNGVTNSSQLTSYQQLNPGNSSSNPPISVNLPICSSDYAQFLGISKGVNNNTFNVFIRGNPLMGTKNF